MCGRWYQVLCLECFQLTLQQFVFVFSPPDAVLQATSLGFVCFVVINPCVL